MMTRSAKLPLAAVMMLGIVLGGENVRAADLLKVAVAQRGQWDTAVTELGQRSGILAKRGITVDILYTQGGPEAHQAVISGSMDIACGGGVESAVGAYSKGAPLRIIGSAMIGSPDTYWFVPANSPIKSKVGNAVTSFFCDPTNASTAIRMISRAPQPSTTCSGVTLCRAAILIRSASASTSG